MKTKVAVGIDIGGTNTVAGLVDVNAKIIATINIKTSEYPDVNEFVDILCSKIISKVDNIGNLVLAGAGIGAPNGNFYNGSIEFAPNLKWDGIVPLAEMVKSKLDVPVILTNDANAAAIGEIIYGSARNIRNFLFITLGTGLGSGIVVNGELVYGHDGFAGEIGHVIIEPDGRQCGCGRKGCAEVYCSATGIKNTFIELITKKKIELKINLENIDAKFIYNEAINNNPLALEAFEITGKYLGFVLANSVAYTSPEAIFLFGGLANAKEYIFKPTIKSFEDNLLKIYKNKIMILPSGLDENNAAVLGAASLIWKDFNLKKD